MLFAVTGAAIGAGTGVAVRSTAAATTMAVAGHSLVETAARIGAALDADDLDRARALLPSLVGRDPAGLDEQEVARAVVESVAENTVDAVVAPALWGALAGAPGVLAHRAVNTLDSMVGHRSDRYANFGWASARLDDGLAWLPARITAVLVAMVRPGRAGTVAHCRAYPGPGPSVPQRRRGRGGLRRRVGAAARRGEPLRRAGGAPTAARGTGGPSAPSDIHRAVRLSQDVGSGLAAVLVAAGTLRGARTGAMRSTVPSAPIPPAPIPPAGAHGGDGPAIAAALGLDPDRVLDLSLSLNPVAPDPVPVVARHLGGVRNYPDGTAATTALAGAMGEDRSRVLLTNGGSEAIALVAAVMGGWVDEPEFSLHPRGAGPYWRSNPHSPSGLLAKGSDVADVWDEAFYPLATGRWTRGDPGTVVVGSLTKLFACPGLRIGYVLAEPEVVEQCRRRQPAWSVSGPAVAALPELLDAADLPAWSTAVGTLRSQLVDELASHGLTARPSDANWVLVEHPGLRQLLAPHGIVVRDCTSFGLPEVTRMAVPSAEGLARVASTLAHIDLGNRPESRYGSAPWVR